MFFPSDRNDGGIPLYIGTGLGRVVEEIENRLLVYSLFFQSIFLCCMPAPKEILDKGYTKADPLCYILTRKKRHMTQII